MSVSVPPPAAATAATAATASPPRPCNRSFDISHSGPSSPSQIPRMSSVLAIHPAPPTTCYSVLFPLRPDTIPPFCQPFDTTTLCNPCSLSKFCGLWRCAAWGPPSQSLMWHLWHLWHFSATRRHARSVRKTMPCYAMEIIIPGPASSICGTRSVPPFCFGH